MALGTRMAGDGMVCSGVPSASSPGANKKMSCESLYEGLHEVVHHIIGAQRGVGYERMPQAHNSLRLFVAMHYFM